MPTREELQKSFASIYRKQTAPKTVASEQKRPEKMCGICKKFKETAFSGEGIGNCDILKRGSDIEANPPVFVLEGTDGYRAMALANAANCKYFEKMDLIDKDGTECSDPVYRRSLRQFQDI
ncbi:MAG: hypothetical protein AB1921_10505 [Thermodesulfobacteriota bacterium]